MSDERTGGAEGHLIYIGAGSNLGNRWMNLRRGLQRLEEMGTLQRTAVSPVYETEPFGPVAQGPFLNLAARFKALKLDPEALLDACLMVEHELGRVRSERWGPRTLDLDILAIKGATHESERLRVPHPELLKRPFVLVPLADIAPELVVEGKTVAAWLTDCGRAGVKEAGAL